eukprot:scaffold22587_cov70-Cyclotella_meneghiniana.AAC.6
MFRLVLVDIYDQEMMGWQDPKITVTMTWRVTSYRHNILNTGSPTTGASSAIHQHHLDECQMRRLALGGLPRPLHPFSPQIPFIFAVFGMNGNLRRNGCSGRGRPPRANCRPPSVIWMNGAERADDKNPVVKCWLSTMLWG